MARLLYIAAAAMLAVANSATAEDRFPSQRSDSFEWGLGFGALVEDEGYRNLDFETSGVPILYLSHRNFRFFANQLDVRLFDNGRFKFGVKAEARFDGFESGDDPFFDGMEDREGGVFAGIRAEYETDYGNFVGEWQTDVSGKSDGAYGSLGSYWIIDAGRGRWVPKVALEYYDGSYTDYYFGVRADEATADRPAYSADSALHVDVGVDYFHKLTDRQQLIASLKYRHYGSAVKDSPLLDSNGSPRFTVGYLYTF